ncbi:CinA family protein [Nitrosophilus alvini]|uniref:CinA family protein n=1 Tax=Nitrosophilus alvini TaxID=2714855 RepID=UPI00190BA11B|nr:CinA family protein [Nitrosophilus alvini]
MKNALLAVGKEFQINSSFYHYIQRSFREKTGECDNIVFIEENDKNLFIELQEIISKYDNVLIAANKTAFATVSKIISTLTEDNLVVKENMLIPSKSEIYKENSYLIEFEKRNINVILAEECQKLPEILLKSEEEHASLQIFNLEKEEILTGLSALANTYEVSLSISNVTKEWNRVCATSNRYGELALFVQNAKLLFPQNIIVSENIFQYLIERLSFMRKTVTFAESCTGGLLASLLTKVPGSSTIFKGSLVTYANEIKSMWLGVKPETLNNFGAVSKETVKEMLSGALKVSESDFALAVSGIAGPGGATKTKPVGTVVVGAKSNTKEIVKVMHFEGDREYIQYQASFYALKLLFDIAKDDLF